MQSLNLSRHTKNRILIAVNILALIVLWIKMSFITQPLSLSFQYWMWAAPPILLLNLLPLQRFGWAYLGHVLLFLLTGAIVGFTVAQAIRYPGEMFILEWIWLPLALLAAGLHYSTSRNDPYQ